MKSKPKILTILSGVITILIGIFIGILSSFVFLSSIEFFNPLVILFTFGILLIIQIVIFLIVLTVGILFILMGAFEIKLGVLPNHKYSSKLGRIIAYSILNSITIIVGIIAAVIASDSLVSISGIVISVLTFICLLFKILDFSIFKKKVNKGLISVANPKEELILSRFPKEELILSKDTKKVTTQDIGEVQDIKETKNDIPEKSNNKQGDMPNSNPKDKSNDKSNSKLKDKPNVDKKRHSKK